MARSKPEPAEIKEWARHMKDDLAHNGMFIMILSLLEHIDQLETKIMVLDLKTSTEQTAATVQPEDSIESSGT